MTCKPASQACCRGIASYTCIDKSQACVASVKLSCDDSSDCAAQGLAGQICCGQFENGRIARAVCAQPQNCASNNTVWFCDPNEKDSCPPNLVCRVSQQTFPGYNLCLTPP